LSIISLLFEGRKQAVSRTQVAVDRERTRALLADILGPVLLRHDSEGEWEEMEEPANGLRWLALRF
jgi:hypothetical protein